MGVQRDLVPLAGLRGGAPRRLSTQIRYKLWLVLLLCALLGLATR